MLNKNIIARFERLALFPPIVHHRFPRTRIPFGIYCIDATAECADDAQKRSRLCLLHFNSCRRRSVANGRGNC